VSELHETTARLYADEDIAPELVEVLRSYHFDIVTARDSGTLNASDDVQLCRATDEGRILISHNWSDYVLLHRAWQNWTTRWNVQPHPEHAGVITILQGNVMRYSDSAFEVDRLLRGRPLAVE
jgi:hypothetical protein